MLVHQLAAALRAEKLILMTDVPGVMRNKDDISTKYAELDIRETRQARLSSALLRAVHTQSISWHAPVKPLRRMHDAMTKVHRSSGSAGGRRHHRWRHDPQVSLQLTAALTRQKTWHSMLKHDDDVKYMEGRT